MAANRPPFVHCCTYLTAVTRNVAAFWQFYEHRSLLNSCLWAGMALATRSQWNDHTFRSTESVCSGKPGSL